MPFSPTAHIMTTHSTDRNDSANTPATKMSVRCRYLPSGSISAIADGMSIGYRTPTLTGVGNFR